MGLETVIYVCENMHKLEGMGRLLTVERQKESPAAGSRDRSKANHSQSNTETKKRGKILLRYFKGISTRKKR